MLQAMTKLTNKSDVLRVVITLLACLAVWGIMEAFIQSVRGRWIWPVIFAVIFLAVLVGTLNSLRGRAAKLLQGRCPHPLCHGTVHHSERARRGYLICPTCKNSWPEVPGIKFRATGREAPH